MLHQSAKLNDFLTKSRPNNSWAFFLFMDHFSKSAFNWTGETFLALILPIRKYEHVLQLIVWENSSKSQKWILCNPKIFEM